MKLFRKKTDLIPIMLYFVDDEFRRSHQGIPTEKIRKNEALLQLLRTAEMNGVLYPLCRNLVNDPIATENLQIVKAYLKKEEDRLRALEMTLEFVRFIFEKEGLDFLFIKLYRQLPYAPRDIDILVRFPDMDRVLEMFQKNGFVAEVRSKVEVKCQRADLLKVDLYAGFYYLSLPFFSDEFMWKNKRVAKIQNVDCYVPNSEAEFLSLVIHSLVGHRRLSLLDFLYAKNELNSDKLNVGELHDETSRYGWMNVFDKVCLRLQDMYSSLYHDERQINQISFPYIYSTKFVLEALQSVPRFSKGTRKEVLFILSAFLDGAYHKYLSTQQLLSIELPENLKKAVGWGLFRIRDFRGDRKTPSELR